MIRMHVVTLAALGLMAAPALAQEGEELGANWGGEGGKMEAGEVGEAGKGQSGRAVYDDLLRVDDREPPAGTPVVWARLFPVSERFEVSLGYEMSVIDKYATHQGGKLNLIYHFNELLAANFFGGYLYGKANGLLMATLNEGTRCDPVSYKNCLPDTNVMSWMVGADFIAEPFYGKLNLVSELALNFDIFIGAGGGVTGRQGFTADSGSGVQQWVRDPARAGVSPFVSAMAGVRVWLWDNLSLRVEARDYTWMGDRPYLELNQPSLQQDDIINTWTLMFGLGATL
ncbi:MAG: outer membrane beta-barrel domain-containing protein [Myxococcota bacterium]|nr:outer membrane beta-barrel domain-containing protein [Myxococcota bacterium]